MHKFLIMIIAFSKYQNKFKFHQSSDPEGEKLKLEEKKSYSQLLLKCVF